MVINLLAVSIIRKKCSFYYVDKVYANVVFDGAICITCIITFSSSLHFISQLREDSQKLVGILSFVSYIPLFC